jgi:hypothetical protein
MINVHVFDSQLKGDFKSEHIPNNTKLRLLVVLQRKLENPHARHNLNIIMQDMNHSPGNTNYQIENDMDATDILASILLSKSYKDNEKDMFPILEEQLADISMGQCPSGRVTRLFQVWKALQD